MNEGINKDWIIYVVVWFFLGGLGIHRFMAGKVGSGIGMLALQVIGFLTLIFLIGLLFIGIAWIWWLIDGIMLLTSKFKEKNGKIIKMKIQLKNQETL